jgi:transcriptional regulator of acetoin/glycerol metabolism
VVDEKAQLEERILKLQAFFKSATFAGLGPREQDRLQRQMLHMKRLAGVLGERVSAFFGIVQEEPAPVQTMAEAREDAIQAAMRATGGNIQAAAKLLGVGRNTLHRRFGNRRGEKAVEA